MCIRDRSVTLNDGTGKTIIVTNTRQVGKTTFTKEGSDNATLPGAVYAVLTKMCIRDRAAPTR